MSLTAIKGASARTLLATALAVGLLAGCAAVSQRPVLYPNAKFKQVGDSVAQKDIEECAANAERAGASAGGSQAARGGMQGAAMGAAGSAVGTLIRGGNIIEGAAAGAAVGGAAGAAGGAFQTGEGSGVYRNFVGRCLAERGYEVIGWK